MSALRRTLIASILAAGTASAAEPRQAATPAPTHAVDRQAAPLQEVAHEVRDLLADRGIPATVDWRVKTPESLAAKMRWKGLAPHQVLDRLGVRVIVDDPEACYAVRDLLLDRYDPVPGSDKDYIQHPKPNGYQSLHVAADTPADVVEFQVRTHAMHATAEHGSAAHWRYKLASVA